MNKISFLKKYSDKGNGIAYWNKNLTFFYIG